MSNFDTVVLDGEMGLFTTIREGDLPYYTGATEVTPSDQTQTLPTADTIVTSNITINPIPDIDLEEVQVTYTPDEEGQTDTITPSTGYAGISEVEVTIEPIDTDYVGSGIARNDSDDLTASGATVTAPAGYYEEAATKTIASGSAATPATTITANPSISVGNDGSITASVSATQSVTPSVTAGYVSSGTAGTITVSGSGSSQLSTQAGTTITPSTSQQTAVAAGKFTTGTVIVDAMPSGTAGTPTATKGTVSNHSVSVTPSVTNTTGYITGGTKTGTAVTVSASELVSGTKSITSNGTGIDVTDYAEVDVNVSSGAISVVDTLDSHGGTIRTITGVDLSEHNGKVVQSGALVSQTSATYTTNDTYDTTTISSVTVNVSGGASNIVSGTFTTNSTAGVQTISIPYTGNGYPMMAQIYTTGGINATTQQAWHDSIVSRQIGAWSFTKRVMSPAPTYDDASEKNLGSSTWTFKNSSSDPSVFGAQGNASAQIYRASGAASGGASCCRFTNDKTISIYVDGTGDVYGFPNSVEFTYMIVYSE